MDDPSHVAGVAQVIQAAVAPVFLLAGVGATLNVLASRIGRIIDRARIMEDRLHTATPDISRDLHARLRVLSRARHADQSCDRVVRAVRPARLAGGRCAVRQRLAPHRSRLPIAVAFVIALLSLAAALLHFLREVFIATGSLTFGGIAPRVERNAGMSTASLTASSFRDVAKE